MRHFREEHRHEALAMLARLALLECRQRSFCAFLFADGSRCSVEHDWEGLHVEAQTLCGQLLQDIAWDLHTRRIFNVVLTPDYNAAHYNHFHVDLTPGSHFLG